MKRVVAVSLFLTAMAAGSLFSQNEFGFVGKYEDATRIKQSTTNDTNQLMFARLIYNGQIPGYYKNWYTDYPTADRWLINALKRLTNLDIADDEHVVAVTDPDLFKFPFIYSSEVGQMVFNAEDAAVMREYLERGGFWMMDDFWGSTEWGHLESQMRKILPDAVIKDLPRDHTLFHLFYDVDELMQVPSLAYASYSPHITYEQDGFDAKCKGVFDSAGRLVAVINHNTDLGDAYEWADDPRYPHRFSGYAYRIALNSILYALTH